MTALVRDPIYRQLHQALRALAAGREFAPGARFLTERGVAERFGVSRATANKAIAGLVAEGALEFRKGVGTYVAGGGLDYDLRALVSFTDKARSAGREATTRVLAFRRLDAARVPPEARARLGHEAGAFAVERLRLADGEPMILERRWVSTAACPNLRARDVAGSLYAAFVERHGLTIAGAEQAIRAVRAGAREARLLRVPRGEPLLLVVAAACLEGGRPLWFERTLYRSDRYEFHARLDGLRGRGSAVGRFAAERTQQA